jgi:hypothetical protein
MTNHGDAVVANRRRLEHDRVVRMHAPDIGTGKESTNMLPSLIHVAGHLRPGDAADRGIVMVCKRDNRGTDS